MKTDDLITMLASDNPTVPLLHSTQRFVLALGCGLLGALLLMACFFGARKDLAEVAATPLFWAKVALPAALVLGALWAAGRLARPGVAVGSRWAAIAAPVMLVWGASLVLLAALPAGDRLAVVLGSTWRTCPLNIALLSVPAFIAVNWALRGLAPTRLRLAGAAGGLLAGALATLVYCLHCPEMAVPFWGVWYVLGMALPTLAGWLLGPRLLRW
ncbi:DUF1109 domain-containing protein [Pseudomonas sp. No.21]|uniref:DUF1109 domain-containing protein n=1 Tax=Pseudomonas TaxID=286 RepID=UPI000DAA9C1B|nr:MULTISPECIES: DUF1109 domain-containing protein [Pseudomonas]PZE14159.1 DUF1109 domain-containing protein [Pseudomonas sp. 57B-090624]GJN46003.1 hypothetical protein TUM20249_19890 [Pseudomonas tohonis]